MQFEKRMDMLIVHQPPGEADGFSKNLSEFVLKHKPLVVVCGHIDVSIRCHWPGTICRRSGAPDRTWLTTEPEDVHVKLLLKRGRRIGDRRVGARKRSEHTRAQYCAKYTL